LKSRKWAAVIPSKARNLAGIAALAARFFVATLLRMTFAYSLEDRRGAAKWLRLSYLTALYFV
jgi:hypothetical protein